MGLLNRAQDLDDLPSGIGMADAVSRAEKILEGFRHSPEHLDFPGEFFDAFRELIGFSKGSLLFPDADSEEYYPWIVEGLDRTSARRLRIPFDHPFFSESSGSVSKVDSSHLGQMLSNREFDMAGDVLMLSFGKSQPLSALVLALDVEKVPIRDASFTQAYEILAEGLTGGIEKCRQLMTTGGEEEPMDPVEWIRTWESDSGTLIILDVSEAIDNLVETVKGLELYRARRDVIAMVRNINGRMGRLYDLKDGRVMILFPEGRLPDKDLYLHQLTHAFSSSILDSPEAPRFPSDFYKLPDELDKAVSTLSGYDTK